jgi:Site-specific recombinase XerD
VLYAAMRLINRPGGEDAPPAVREMLRRLLAVRATADWRDGGLHSARPLTPARIRRVHATLSSALTTAVRKKKITHDPSKNVELASAKVRRPLLWTPERVARWDATGVRPGPVMVWPPDLVGAFLDWLQDSGERLYPLIHLIATRGLRRGEVIGLEWADTDLDGARTISVLEDEDPEAEDRIKTDSSRRVIILDAENVRLLKAWRAEQAAERLRAGSDWVDSGRVFTNERGEPLVPGYLSERWARLVRRSGLPPVRLHDLRHCAATLMMAAGVPMKVISETLGHAKYWWTADTYGGVVPQLAEAAAEATVAVVPRRRARGR